MTWCKSVAVNAYLQSPILASLSLPQLEALAVEGGYTGLAALSNFSAVLLLSGAAAFLHDYRNWTGDGLDLTEDEMDTINELVSKAEAEIIMSAVGLIFPIANAAVPEYMLLCDGTQYLRVDYPELYEVLDPVFIVDPDNFVVPDLRDRMVIGSPTTPVGQTGGSNSHTLTVGQLPPHSHKYDKETSIVIPSPDSIPSLRITRFTIPTDTSETGDGDSVDHQNPYIALLYCIVSGI